MAYAFNDDRSKVEVKTKAEIEQDYVKFDDTMTASKAGVAKVGSGLEVSNGALQLNGGDMGGAVADWLDDHPEATTTVQDGSVTNAKLVQTGGILDGLSNQNYWYLSYIQKDTSIKNDGTTEANQFVDVASLKIPDNAFSVTVYNCVTIDGTRYSLANAIAFYDEDETLIEVVHNTTTIGFINVYIPSNAVFIKVAQSNEQDDLDSICIKFKSYYKDLIADNNIFPTVDKIIGSCINIDGTIINGFARTDYIEIPEIFDYVEVFNNVQGFSWSSLVSFFDSEKTFVGAITGLNLPIGYVEVYLGSFENCKYIVVNYDPSKSDQCLVKFTGKKDSHYYLDIINKAIANDSNNLLTDYIMAQRTNKKYIDTDGNEVTQVSLACTPMINVEFASSVVLWNSFGGYAYNVKGAWYDDNGDFISPAISAVVGYTEFIKPSNAKYIRVNMGLVELSSEVCKAKASLPEWLIPQSQSKWAGKKAVFLGDSITEGTCTQGVTNPYPTVLASKLSLGSYVNYGIGGTFMTGTSENSFINRYSSMDDDADLVVVMGGTNDALYGPSNWLGTSADIGQGNISFYGGLDVLQKGLMAKYPNSTIVFMTPLHYYDQDGSPTHNEKNTDKQMDAWGQAIQEVCKRNGLPCIDFRNICGLNPNIAEIRTIYFQDQWIHPNQNGINKYVDRIYKNFELF